MSVPTKCEVKTSSYKWHIKGFSDEKFTFYEQSSSDDEITGELLLHSDEFPMSICSSNGCLSKVDVNLCLRRDAKKDLRTNKITATTESIGLTLCTFPAEPTGYDESLQKKTQNMCFAWIHGKEQQSKCRLNAGYFLYETSNNFFNEFLNPEFLHCKDLLDESKGLISGGDLTIVCEVRALTSEFRYVNSWLFDPQEPVSVPKAEHACPLQSDLKEMYESGVNSDVTLVAADGREFPAHVAILSSRSPVFAAMFAHNMEEKRLNRANIGDMSSETMEGLLKFMYTDVISSDITVVAGLLVAADKYGISSLKMLCEQVMMATLNKDNAAEFFLLADKHHADKLRKAAMRFTATHLMEINPIEGWQKWMNDNQELAAEILKEMAELMAELTSSS